MVSRIQRSAAILQYFVPFLIMACFTGIALACPGMIHSGHACQNNSGCQAGQTKYTTPLMGGGTCNVFQCCNHGLRASFGYHCINVNQLLGSICCFDSQRAEWDQSQTPVRLICRAQTTPCSPYEIGCEPGDL